MPNFIKNLQTNPPTEPTVPGVPPKVELGLDYRPVFTLPLLGEPAPPFKAMSTKGPINFPADYKGKWVLFFSYPGDFCATCTTEMIALAKNKQFYDELGVEVVALSIDSLSSHLAWLKSIYNLEYDDVKNTIIDFPIIADTSMDISREYGLLRRGETETETVRGGFLIDPKGKIRAIQIYPREVGSSGPEIRRVVEAIMKFDKENVYTPANWKPGDDVLLVKPETFDEILYREEFANERDDVYCPEWYLCFRKDGTRVPPMPPQNNVTTPPSNVNPPNAMNRRPPINRTVKKI